MTLSPKTTIRFVAGLSAIAAVSIGIATYLNSGPRGSHFLTTFGPNLAPDALGVLLALFLVDPILKLRRQRELEPLRAAALGAFGVPLSSLIQLLVQMYKASEEPAAAADPPVDLAALLSRWPSAVPNLDFRRSAPISPPMPTWGQWVQQESTKIALQIEPILDRYAEALGVEAVSAAQEFLNDGLIRFFQQVGNYFQPGGSEAPLQAHGMADAVDGLAGHALAFLRALRQDTYVIPDPFWTSISPAWGDARI